MIRLSLRGKLILVSLALAAVPVALVGGLSLWQMTQLGEETADLAYGGLREQALSVMDAGIRGDVERVSGLVTATERDTRRLAGSATLEAYLSAEQGRNAMLNEMARKELNRIVEGGVSLCAAQADQQDVATAKKRVAEQLLKVGIGKTGYVFVMDSEGVLKVHPNQSIVGKNTVTDLKLTTFADILTEKKTGEYGILSYEFEGRSKCVAYSYVPEWDWIICASAYWDELSVQAATSAMGLLKAEIEAFLRDSTVQVDGQPEPLYTQARLLRPDGECVLCLGTEADTQNVGGKEWFAQAAALKPGQMHNTGVIPAGDTATMRVASPVYLQGRLAGVLAVDLDWPIVWERIRASKYGKSGYPYVVNDRGVLVSHPKYALADGVNLSDTKYGPLASLVREEMLTGKTGNGEYEWEGRNKYAAFAPIKVGGRTYSVAASCYVEEFVSAADAIRDDSAKAAASVTWWVLVAGIVVALLGAGVGVWVASGIAHPIQRIIESLTGGAEQVSSAAGEVSTASQSLAEGASEQAATVQEATASVEEITSMIKQNAGFAGEAAEVSERNTASSREAQRLAHNATTATDEGNQAVTRMTEAISQIKTSSEETGRIVKTIDEIAFQTNLLALNAAVEAARAGEAGKGFAVVAEEVRNLAQRAGQAARETASLIEEALKNSDHGVQVSGEVSESLGRIAESIQQVTAVAGDVATASQEQTRIIEQVANGGQEQAKGIEQISESLNEMDTVTQRNAATAEESASASEELSGQAEMLMDTVRELQSLVGGGRSTPHGETFRLNGESSVQKPRTQGRSAFRQPTEAKKDQEVTQTF
ncbi:MAG: methyl-accepting chemotaxis protein [Phycisphaerae bacterium]